MKEITLYFGKPRDFPFYTNKGKFYDFKIVLNSNDDVVISDSINRFVPIAVSDIGALIKALKKLKKKSK